MTLRIDIERALDELASQEEGMRFQGLAVIIGKLRWPELIARQRKKDQGLDAYAPSSLTPEKIGKGLAASITPTLKKVSDDVRTAKVNFTDLKTLLFVTSAKVGNAARKKWEEAIQKQFDVELHLIEREEIISLMLMPASATIRLTFLNIFSEYEAQSIELLERVKCASTIITRNWMAKTKGHPLINLTGIRLTPDGADSTEQLGIHEIDYELSHSTRIILEGAAGRGKTTTLIQLAQRERAFGIPVILELPLWVSSRRSILDYIAGMPSFQAQRLSGADLAQVHNIQPFLFLLNGWNEITEYNSEAADGALREISREFPTAGIIVATRTHHLTPPLPGAIRVRLSPLQPVQRTAYIKERLGGAGKELCIRIESDPSLDELTRTPLILSEVASLFEARIDIPSTKMAILSAVLSMHEQREEHKNPLQLSPICGHQARYLTAISNEMTRRGAVSLTETEARSIITNTVKELVSEGQIDRVSPQLILTALTAHHVLELSEYPQTEFQFEHQQLQEYYAAVDLRNQLFKMDFQDKVSIDQFTDQYVNQPAWTEVLRLIAEESSAPTLTGNAKEIASHTGANLILMALSVDLVFSGELAFLCGSEVWNLVNVRLCKRLREVYRFADSNFSEYALAAMLATGNETFSDIILPLLSSDEVQTRIKTYRLWSEFHISSIGFNWREQVCSWSDQAREDFVSEMLTHRVSSDLVTFAIQDDCMSVKVAAVHSLMWTKACDEAGLVLESMDYECFQTTILQYVDQIPLNLKSKCIAAIREFIATSKNLISRLMAAYELIELGENDLDEPIKHTLMALSNADVHKLESLHLKHVIQHLSEVTSEWTTIWLTNRIAEGNFYDPKYWLSFTNDIPSELLEGYLNKLQSEQLEHKDVNNLVTIVSARGNAEHASGAFIRLRDLRRQIISIGGKDDLNRQLSSQLEMLLRSFPPDILVEGILSAIDSNALIDMKVTVDLLSNVARSDESPLLISNDNLRARLKTYLKACVKLALQEDDDDGRAKANLASVISQVGTSDDMTDLILLVQSDVERVKLGRAAYLAGDRGPLGSNFRMSYANWYLRAISHLDDIKATQTLVNLLAEPEYRFAVAEEMARAYAPKTKPFSVKRIKYKSIWAARKISNDSANKDERRERFSLALNSQIEILKIEQQGNNPFTGIKGLAKSLVYLDPQKFKREILDALVISNRGTSYLDLEIAEQLLAAGIILPTSVLFPLIDSILERTENWIQDSDRQLLCSLVSLCPFIDEPKVGVIKVREVLNSRKFRGHELRDIIEALGESRCDEAVELIGELMADNTTFELCADELINSLALLDTPVARELLLKFVETSGSIPSYTGSRQYEETLVCRLSELASKSPEVAVRIQTLNVKNISEANRQILSKTLASIGTINSFSANLLLINNDGHYQVPQGLWDYIMKACIEERPYSLNSSAFTRHGQVANDIRYQLFRIVVEDNERRKGALQLLGQIERLRLEYGRPNGEARHPDFNSNLLWPC